MPPTHLRYTLQMPPNHLRYTLQMPPNHLRYTLRMLHANLSGIHFSILNLKALKVSDCFITLDTKSHDFGPR